MNEINSYRPLHFRKGSKNKCCCLRSTFTGSALTTLDDDDDDDDDDVLFQDLYHWLDWMRKHKKACFNNLIQLHQ